MFSDIFRKILNFPLQVLDWHRDRRDALYRDPELEKLSARINEEEKLKELGYLTVEDVD